MASAGKTGPKKANSDPSPTVTNLIIILTTVSFVSLASLYWLQEDAWVQGQKYWLISRAAAMAAYIAVSLVVMLGIVISHPLNKEKWRLTPALLPWHQTLMGAVFALIILHVFFTVVDDKSGISWSNLWFPIHSKYHPLAMMLGVFGLYALFAVTMTAAFRKWFRFWLQVHRLSWISWLLLCLHGMIGGTDVQFRPAYWLTGGIILFLFCWRHWTSRGLEQKAAVNANLADVSVSGDRLEG